jgi:hypothetical protein
LFGWFVHDGFIWYAVRKNIFKIYPERTVPLVIYMRF